MTHAAGLDLDQDFAGSRAVQIHGDDFEGLAAFSCDSGFGFHLRILP
jgi:hypothetical protein